MKKQAKNKEVRYSHYVERQYENEKGQWTSNFDNYHIEKNWGARERSREVHVTENIATGNKTFDRNPWVIKERHIQEDTSMAKKMKKGKE